MGRGPGVWRENTRIKENVYIGVIYFLFEILSFVLGSIHK